MKHPILDCVVPIESGIEAHKEKLESDLSEKKQYLTLCLLQGVENYSLEHITELIVDIGIIEEYLGKSGSQI